ncbi:hypothetical protein [Cohnella sp. 56]|uniref:hypothetical protein n=1 Tax=Cohnella sp. 56 TaxID=3113722 RepID=UPI0030E88221
MLQKELRVKEQQLPDISRELQRKDAALAETAALLVLRKKPRRSGGSPGTNDQCPRAHVSRYTDSGSPAHGNDSPARRLGLPSEPCNGGAAAADAKMAFRLLRVPRLAHKLSAEEEQQILDIVHQAGFQSLPPSKIVPALSDQGTYFAFESSFYRVMRKHNQQHERGRSKKRTASPLTSHSATGANQVWMWDITWLPGPARGLFYYLYLVLDHSERGLFFFSLDYPISTQ